MASTLNPSRSPLASLVGSKQRLPLASPRETRCSSHPSRRLLRILPLTPSCQSEEVLQRPRREALRGLVDPRRRDKSTRFLKTAVTLIPPPQSLFSRALGSFLP